MGKITRHLLNAVEDSQEDSSGDVHCLFCLQPIERGVYWCDGSFDVFFCLVCVADGKFGVLIGDASRSAEDVEKIVLKTRAEAFRVLAQHHEAKIRYQKFTEELT